MLFNITFSSSVIEIYKKKKKTLLKLLFLFGNKNENAKKRDLYGFYFYYLYYYQKFFVFCLKFVENSNTPHSNAFPFT